MGPAERGSGKKAASKADSVTSPNVPLYFSPLEFRRVLAVWYKRNARRLPWRGVKNPYATWLSEIMLQQTRVATVMDRYRAFIVRFPTLASLANADEADVLALWSGLGYYQRARMLHRSAQFVERELRGKFPRTSKELCKLPGVGEYTAAAIASIAYGELIAVVDGNVERVLLRVLGRAEDKSRKALGEINEVAQTLMAARVRGAGAASPGDHNQAMMELGATICLPRDPLCLQCPVFDFCRTRGEHVTAQREPQRSRSVAHLLAVRKRGTQTEVLLERRSAEASIMPSMLELPPLPLDAVTGREPVLRLRHSITNTNYYVQIFTESVVGSIAAAHEQQSDAGDDEPEDDEPENDDELFVASPGELHNAASLMNEISAAASQLEWVAVNRLAAVPLTGMARKVMQRLRVMAVPKVELGG
jgi:A/G-specific adenine glycosylase